MSFIDRPFDAFDPASLAEYIAWLEVLAARGMDVDHETALARDLLTLARDRERLAADRLVAEADLPPRRAPPPTPRPAPRPAR